MSTMYVMRLLCGLLFFPGKLRRGGWMMLELQVQLESVLRFACAPKART